MRICPQKKQPWDNLNACAGNCLAAIVRRTGDNLHKFETREIQMAYKGKAFSAQEHQARLPSLPGAQTQSDKYRGDMQIN